MRMPQPTQPLVSHTIQCPQMESIGLNSQLVWGGFDPFDGEWTIELQVQDEEKPRNIMKHPKTNETPEHQAGSIQMCFLFLGIIHVFLAWNFTPRQEMNPAYCVDMRAFGIKVGSPSSSCLREVLQDRQRMLQARDAGELAFCEELLGFHSFHVAGVNSVGWWQIDVADVIFCNVVDCDVDIPVLEPRQNKECQLLIDHRKIKQVVKSNHRWFMLGRRSSPKHIDT